MLRITWPFHGAVLNQNHGVVEGDSLRIKVTGDSGQGGVAMVNGAPAELVGGRFEAEVVLIERETEIVAVQGGPRGRQEHRVRVVWDQHSFPRYRFSIDDNSFFLRDIAEKQYDSLFDCFYLDMLRQLNREYGAKFTVNIYHEAIAEFGQDRFVLSDFPDRYKGEWEACADCWGWPFMPARTSPTARTSTRRRRR